MSRRINAIFTIILIVILSACHQNKTDVINPVNNLPVTDTSSYKTNITTSKDEYKTGETAVFEIKFITSTNVSAEPKASFPDINTEIQLDKTGENTYKYSTLLFSSGEKTLSVSFFDSAKSAGLKKKKEELTGAINALENKQKVFKNDSVATQINTYKQELGNVNKEIASLKPLAEAQKKISIKEDTIIPSDPTGIVQNGSEPISSDGISVDFLYSGNNPIQTGVSTSTIDNDRVVVIRGKVLDNSNSAVLGVKITVLNHPEFGQTYSRKDGMFDMAVNGGGYLTVQYTKNGYLPIQRGVITPWQDFAAVPDVIMTALDSKSSSIDLASSQGISIAQGTVKSDEDGKRQATLLVPAGVSAKMVMPDGTKKQLSKINIRATEYTVGNNGPKAMPAELPPSSGYTYCLEYSVDEALNAGASDVVFSTPLYHYNENFLNFPVGGIVPVGYYDKIKGQWIASENGRIIKIINIINGKAELDVDGSNTAATQEKLDELNITNAELVKLGGLYKAGTSLWRVPIKHFTPWDCNWPYGPPPDARPPDIDDPKPDDKKDEDDTCKTKKCVIEVQNQILKETIPVIGTPFSLNYNSGNVLGNKSDRLLNIPIGNNSLPASLKQITLDVSIAGQRFLKTFLPGNAQDLDYEWDGKDAYGREIFGARNAVISIGYKYGLVYYEPSDFQNSFSRFGKTPISGNRQAAEVTLYQYLNRSLSNNNSLQQGFGLWTLNICHKYDAFNNVLYRGDGSRVSLTKAQNNYNTKTVISTIAGTGKKGYSGDGGPAIDARLHYPGKIAADDEGNIYFVEISTSVVRKIDKHGIITTIAGTGRRGYSGDGGPAILAALNQPKDIKVDSDGNIFILDGENNCIRKVDKKGIITTFAGKQWNSQDPTGYLNSFDSSEYNNYPSSAAIFGSVVSIDLSEDGTLYVLDRIKGILLIDKNNTVTAICSGIFFPNAFKVLPDGGFYIAQSFNLSKISNNGEIKRVIGSDLEQPGELPIGIITDFAIDGTGTVYCYDSADKSISIITSTGVFKIAGGGNPYAPIAENSPSLKAYFEAGGICTDPKGNIYLTDQRNYIVRCLSSVSPKEYEHGMLLSASDIDESYLFDKKWKHIKTLDSITGKTKYEFEYNGNGLLIKVKDRNGDATIIERDSSGNPLSITGPYGQKTMLKSDSSGYLEKITNPNNESYTFDYSDSGLLTHFTNPRDNTSKYSYDDVGRLTKAETAAGGYSTYKRAVYKNGFEVEENTSENRKKSYKSEKQANGDAISTVKGCCGGEITTVTKPDGTRKITRPDGTIYQTTSAPDQRFGMQSPYISETIIKTPSGLTYKETRSKTAELSDKNDILSPFSSQDITKINGRIYTTEYSSSTRTSITTTPNWNKLYRKYDENGQLVLGWNYNLLSTTYTYDSKGNLVATQQGERKNTVSYSQIGLIDSITDSIGRKVSFNYDKANRITSQTLADSRVINFTYDANGNITSITPPSKPVHSFQYNNVDLREKYTPPANEPTKYEYNLEKEIKKITRPDGKIITFTYDNAGKLNEVSHSLGKTKYEHDTLTGQLKNITTYDNNKLEFVYDGFLNTAIGYSGSINGSVLKYYNNDFNISSITVNGFSPVNFEYNSANQLSNIGDLSISRDYDNGLITGTRINKFGDSFKYNEYGEVTGYSADYYYSTFYRVNYTRDNAGRIVSSTETVNGVKTVIDYNYDTVGRLSLVVKNGVPVSNYSYDANGNRTGNKPAAYDEQDRLLTYNGKTYTYTANGELASSGSTNYYYDEFGNLRKVTLSDGRIIEYIIDAQNRRIGKKVNGVLVKGWLYADGLLPIAELDGSGNVVSQFFGNVIYKGEKKYKIVTTHLGSPRLVVDSQTGEIVQQIEYDEFGQVLNDTNPGFQPFGFAGGLYDTDTKLVRFGARDYDAETGRWTSKDPIDFAGGDTNLYGYCLNDPVNSVDLNGLDCMDDCLRNTYGNSFDFANKDGFWNMITNRPNIQIKDVIQDGYNSLTGYLAGEAIKDLRIAGAMNVGSITAKIAAANKAANTISSISKLNSALSKLSGGYNIYQAGLTGYAFGAWLNCYLECGGCE